ncbi:hypothetical protein JKG68_09700 [Microvirga aerilata]|uniref:Uncharacterized protein n=1 Tax=Microvirga aerilata TaxID=670292 RepID=A0A936ZED9_9HYPH|nr:hypothetical protein [Microvirga aerilata]MBL0404240.1 hypothetical protein [Microvirga aerilata]
MPPRLDKITLRPNPVTGPLLVTSLGLDRAHPGYLRYLTTASTLKRQANFVALMVLEDIGPDYLASRFRAVGLVDDTIASDCSAQIAQVLITARAQDICGCDVLFGTASSTALRVLHRIGNEPLSANGYRALIDLIFNPEHRERGRIFSQECPVSETTIKAALRLPILLVRPEVLTRLKSVEQIDELSAAFDLIFPLLPGAIQSDAWQSLEALSPSTSLRSWLRKLVEKIPRYPVSGPISDDAEMTFLSSPRAMADTGRRLQNCLATLLSQPLLNRYVYYLWHKPECVVELRCLSRGYFVLKGVHTTGHGTVDAVTLMHIRKKFESTGKVLVGAENAEARKANRAAKLLDVWGRGLPNLDDDEVFDLIDIEDTVEITTASTTSTVS